MKGSIEKKVVDKYEIRGYGRKSTEGSVNKGETDEEGTIKIKMGRDVAVRGSLNKRCEDN